MKPEITIRLTEFSHGAGCACKLGTDELAEVMSHLSTSSGDAALLVGLDAADDAAVYKITDEVALVQTVDFFTPIVDDARTWGRIAAANALSDVYAMGGIPKTALNLVAWPRSLGFELLGEVLAGGQEICDEAGVSIVGGHSVDDPEPKYGLAVTGTIDPRTVLTKKGARPGDALVLTKPLGTGIVSTAIKRGSPETEVVEAAIASMTQLNDAGARLAKSHGAHALTDVTGFGLIGHLLQMLGDGVAAEIDAAAVPLLPGVERLVAEGMLAGGSRRNRESHEGRVTGAAGRGGIDVLFDAQTSGGLLCALPSAAAEGFVAALRDSGYGLAAHIGSIVEGDGEVRLA